MLNLATTQNDHELVAAANIFAIAEQCPLSGGRIVHKARSLYHLIDPFYRYEEACDDVYGLRTLGEPTTN